MKKLTPILGNAQKLDGGAMFGHVPQAMWKKWAQPDAQNRIDLACRALLVQDGDRHILLETGIGAFFEPALRERYGVVETNHILLESLQAIGLQHTDIDAVIISHMHFDHAGGLLSAWQEGQQSELLFPNAKYIIGQRAWERACHPHVRDRASFVPHLNQLLEASGRLQLVYDTRNDWLGDDYYFMYSDGHTPGLLHTVIRDTEEGTVIFASDLIPGNAWVHLPVGMGYDRSPELLCDEKQAMLDFAIKEQAHLFYTHDAKVAMSLIEKDEKGRYKPVEALRK